MASSLYNHLVNANDFWYQALNDTPGRVGPSIGKPAATVRQYFLDWLASEGDPFWPFWENARGWWVIRHLPNVLFVHFADLKGDMGGGIRTIAEFLEIAVDETVWLDILKNCRFDQMKVNHTKSVPLGGAFWDGSAQTFIHKGQNGRWRDVLTEASCQAYEARAQ